jgi:hypothetical protein
MTTAVTNKLELDKSGAFAEDSNRHKDRGVDGMIENAEHAFMKAGEFD